MPFYRSTAREHVKGIGHYGRLRLYWNNAASIYNTIAYLIYTRNHILLVGDGTVPYVCALSSFSGFAVPTYLPWIFIVEWSIRGLCRISSN